MTRHFSREDVQTVNKLMRRCATPLVTRETNQAHKTPLHTSRMPRIQNQKIKRGDEGVEKLEPWCIAGRNVNWCNHPGKDFDGFSGK